VYAVQAALARHMQAATVHRAVIDQGLQIVAVGDRRGQLPQSRLDRRRHEFFPSLDTVLPRPVRKTVLLL
jgi:hypothetical protein